MAEINYVPSPGGNVQPGPYFQPVQVGAGAPSGTGSEGSIWMDSSTGDVYEFTGGSWVYQFTTGAGGGGGSSVTFGAFLDPNGNVTAPVGDFYKSAASLGGDESLWVKQTGAGDTGWV